MITRRTPRQSLAIAAGAAGLIMMLTAVAEAGTCNWASCRNTTIGRLVISRDDVQVEPKESPSEIAKLNCALGAGRYFHLLKTHPSYGEILSVLLAAKLANHPIWLRVTGCTAESVSDGTCDPAANSCDIVYVVLE